ncbi:MAG: glutaredoxin family protein, partial [Chlorobiaceae bacterium]|nr:glutaredoxin family protein [Chlorobiaceae bacterium]
MHKLTLYGAKECCLCDDAKAVLERVRKRVPFELEAIDISSDPELVGRYGTEIPVLCIDGVQAFRYGIHEKKLL